MTKASKSHEGDPLENGAGKKQKGYKRSKGGCLNCKFRKVKCDEIRPTCTACQRLEMPCGNYGATLSKAAYAEQKQDFLEQVRRKGKGQENPMRIRRHKKVAAVDTTQDEHLHMQMQLGMVDVLHTTDSPDDIHVALGQDSYPQDDTQDFYTQPHAFEAQEIDSGHEGSSNLFEINPRAAIQQMQQNRIVNREHIEAQLLHRAVRVFNPNDYSDDPALGSGAQNEPYVPSMMTIDNLMNQQQHVMHAEHQRIAEEAAVRARKDETLAQQRRLQEAEQSA